MAKLSKMYVVRIWNKESDPMVGEICPFGMAGIPCWDEKLERQYIGHDQVLVQKNGHKIIGLDPNRL